MRLGSLRSSANKKLIKWKLTAEEEDKLVLSKCYYCGGTNKDSINGIDRLDSTGIYEYDNCVPCCKMCNQMKNSIDIETFYNRIEHILSNLDIIKVKVFHHESFPDHKFIKYKEYVNRDFKRNLETTISKDEFYKLIKEKCYLCGKETSDLHKNGLDRIDNTKCYSKDNCKTCCTDCNYLKSIFEYDDFINKIKKIYNFRIQKDKSANKKFKEKYISIHGIEGWKKYEADRKKKQREKTNKKINRDKDNFKEINTNISTNRDNKRKQRFIDILGEKEGKDYEKFRKKLPTKLKEFKENIKDKKFDESFHDLRKKLKSDLKFMIESTEKIYKTTQTKIIKMDNTKIKAGLVRENNKLPAKIKEFKDVLDKCREMKDK